MRGGAVSKRFCKLLAISTFFAPLALFGIACDSDGTNNQSWGTEFPSSFTPENSGKCIMLGEDNSASPVYNKNDLTDSPFSSSSVTISKNPDSKFSEFYNTGSFNITNDNSFTFDMPDVDFYLSGSFNLQKGSLTLNGRDFYSQGGNFILNTYATLNFGDFINVSGTKITASGIMTINLTGRFSNDSTLTIAGEKGRYSSLLNIKGGDFYNGVDHSSAQEFFSGSIILSNANLDIEKNLISEGVDKDNRSKIIIGDESSLLVLGNFTNGPYSDVFLAGLTNIRATNITNQSQGEMHLKGSLVVGGDFISQAGSRLYFSGIDYYAVNAYGSIRAANINIKGASLYFSKGGASANTPYYFLNATTGTLSYDSSLLGIKDVLSDDGTINEFYEAVVEAASDSKKLKVTFKPKEVNISSDSNSEKTFIDMFSKANPIPGFDIKNLSLNQIRTISKNINDGLTRYSDSKYVALDRGFEAIKANVFARMIGGGSSSGGINYQKRSDIIPYSPSNHYAINTKLAPPTDIASIFEKPKKHNNLYANILGAFQTSSEGYGYGYGLSVGYDRNFDDKLFLGAYLAYIGGGTNLDMLSSQTQGFEVGVYGRFETSILETDVILNQGYAYNKNTKNITILDSTYSTHSAYGTQSFDVLLQSGPKFILGKNSIKPFIGVNLNFYTGANVTEKDETFASSYDFKDSVYLSGSIGVEYKRSFKNGYFFIRPSYDENLYSNATETKVIFLNNTISIAPPAKAMFGSVLLGGEVAINDYLSLNLNASAKASNQKTFIATGMASLKYIF